MGKLDIKENDLCIKRIINVIKSNNSRNHKLLEINGRHSDAFVYVLFGSCTYRFDDGERFTADPGDVFYLPFGSVYSMFIHTDDYRFIFCDFEFEEAATAAALFRGVNNTDILFEKLLNLYSLQKKSRYTECMSVLYGIYNALQRSGEQIYLQRGKKNMIADAKKYIDENFASPEPHIPALAEKMGISEVYFRKLFKNQYNVSPHKYLNSVRLKNAISLMKYPFLSLEECALQSGFSSLQYFCRLFKKELGVSPGKYRK